ncbi:MAG TPA: hypothetical protein VLB02_02240 [Candidatus Paceibacterota bacterium]|nr:hypothetical protein [Candidatus Paceibacterota bacterium]
MSHRIGVIRGGTSSEYPISLKTGAAVLNALREEGYEAIDILLDKDGILHIKGIPATLEQLPHHVDLAWNALHGHFGEDGKLQQLLEATGVPYTGSRALASAMGANKAVAKETARSLGLQVPPSLLVNPAEESDSVAAITQRIYRTMAPPWVVKPLSGGSSINTYLVHTPLELSQIVDEAMLRGELFLVEQYIYGREANVSIIDGFRGQEHYGAPVVEVQKPGRGIFTHEMKYGGSEPQARVGGSFRADERDVLSRHAKAMHELLGAEDVSQSEFIINPYGKIYFLEIDTNPALTDTSLLPLSLQSVGSSLRELIAHIVKRRLGS